MPLPSLHANSEVKQVRGRPSTNDFFALLNEGRVSATVGADRQCVCWMYAKFKIKCKVSFCWIKRNIYDLLMVLYLASVSIITNYKEWWNMNLLLRCITVAVLWTPIPLWCHTPRGRSVEPRVWNSQRECWGPSSVSVVHMPLGYSEMQQTLHVPPLQAGHGTSTFSY